MLVNITRPRQKANKKKLVTLTLVILFLYFILNIDVFYNCIIFIQECQKYI